jgi:hypothetical protein
MTIELDPRTWPGAGRVGYCRAGDKAGAYFFLHLGVDTRDPEYAYWQGYFEPSIPHEPIDEVWADHKSGIMQDRIAALHVEWAPPEVDAEVETRLFGLRELWSARGVEPMPDFHGSPTTATPQVATPYGRASSATALGGLITRIRRARGRTRESIVLDPLAFGRISSRQLAEFEAGNSAAISNLIDVLRVLDYDLAIVPRSGSLLLDDADPWAEFR